MSAGTDHVSADLARHEDACERDEAADERVREAAAVEFADDPLGCIEQTFDTPVLSQEEVLDAFERVILAHVGVRATGLRPSHTDAVLGEILERWREHFIGARVEQEAGR